MVRFLPRPCCATYKDGRDYQFSSRHYQHPVLLSAHPQPKLIMDPLSVIASTITIAGLTAATLERTKALFVATDELRTLLNEVSDFQLVLAEFQRVLTQRREDRIFIGNNVNGLNILLQRASSVFQQMTDQLTTIISSLQSPARLPMKSRLKWFRCSTKVKILQVELRNIRRSLVSLSEASTL